MGRWSGNYWPELFLRGWYNAYSSRLAFASAIPFQMILIRFPDETNKRTAMGRLAGRFSFKSWATGEMLVPESALPFLAVEGVALTVEGPATYEQIGSAFRGTASPAVQ